MILVHRPFITRRFLATAQRQWPAPQPEFFVTSAKYTFVEYLAREDENDLADRSMAAMLRYYGQLDEYFEKGFATHQPKNAKAEAAFRRLIAAGFEPLAQNDDLSTEKFAK